MNNSIFIEPVDFHQFAFSEFSNKPFSTNSFPFYDRLFSSQDYQSDQANHVIHGFQNRGIIISNNSLQEINQYEISEQSSFEELINLIDHHVDSTEELSSVLVDKYRHQTEIDDIHEKKTKTISPMKRERRGHNKLSDIIKGQWTPEEDRILVSLVEKCGVRKWSRIAQMLPGRVGKQCRERWHNHLRPDIKKGRWSEEEDKILIDAHRQLGNKWSEIAKILPGRSENTIKNHWNATKRKQLASRNSTNNPKHNNPLQNYIKSLMMLSSSNNNNNIIVQENSSPGTLSQAHVNTMKSSNLSLIDKHVGFSPNDQIVPATYYNGGDEELSFIGTETFVNGDGTRFMLEDVPYNFDDDGTTRIMEIEMPSSLESQMQFDAKKEMDFLDLLSQGYI